MFYERERLYYISFFFVHVVCLYPEDVEILMQKNVCEACMHPRPLN